MLIIIEFDTLSKKRKEVRGVGMNELQKDILKQRSRNDVMNVESPKYKEKIVSDEKEIVSISIVVYKPDIQILKKTIDGLLLSIKEGPFFHKEFKIYLIDNSCDTTASLKVKKLYLEYVNKEFSSFELINKKCNSGYSVGNNLAINKSTSKYHLVLNPDAFLEKEFFTNAINFMEKNGDVGLLAPAVFGQDNNRHYVHKRNPTLFIMFLRGLSPSWLKTAFQKHITAYEMQDVDWSKPVDEIGFVSGCCMFFRTDLLKEVGCFDERFFLYYEDADITRKIRKVSRVSYSPNLKVIHMWKRETHSSLKMKIITIKSGLKYFWKWGGWY